jgi:hypothetical protein
MSVDHVVPRGEARRVGIDPQFYEDAFNLVLCCSGCNGFGNRYRCVVNHEPMWTLEEFLALRDRIFEECFKRIAQRRAAEVAFFESKPWGMPATP